jgi:hypothetical protein
MAVAGWRVGGCPLVFSFGPLAVGETLSRRKAAFRVPAERLADATTRLPAGLLTFQSAAPGLRSYTQPVGLVLRLPHFATLRVCARTCSAVQPSAPGSPLHRPCCPHLPRLRIASHPVHQAMLFRHGADASKALAREALPD